MEHHCRRCGHELGNAGEPETCAWLDQKLAFQIAIACSTGPYQRAVAGYGGRHARDAVSCDLSLEDGIGDQALRFGVDCGGVRRNGIVASDCGESDEGEVGGLLCHGPRLRFNRPAGQEKNGENW